MLPAFQLAVHTEEPVVYVCWRLTEAGPWVAVPAAGFHYDHLGDYATRAATWAPVNTQPTDKDVGTTLRHYKGDLYTVRALVQTAAGPQVLYQNVTVGHAKEGALWLRPQAMFNGLETYQGQQVERFGVV